MLECSEQVETLIKLMKSQNKKLVTAESCTGGMMAACITHLPGASSVFERGFITYANEAKQELLGISRDLIQSRGAVSTDVAAAMAAGALKNSHTHIALSCTGIAGPGGATATKPVGLVYIGLCEKGDKPQSFEHHFEGDRYEIRLKTVQAAFDHLISYLRN